MLQVTAYAKFKNWMGNVNLIDVIYDIRSGKYAQVVNRIRVYMDKDDPEMADRLKKSLPATTLSATYLKRRLPTEMTGYNPLIILDLDNLSKDQLPRLLALLREADYTVACWISPRGRGIKVIVYPAVGIELMPENHATVYNLVKDWYEKLLGVEIDASGKDIGRLCLVSYAPALYLSPRFEPWLKGEGSLPDDLPRMESVISNSVGKLLASARKKASRQMVYAPGNRNNYVHLFASYCNRMGIERRYVEKYIEQAFTDLPMEECGLILESAYARVEEHGKAVKKKSAARGNGFVDTIQEFLVARYELRHNVVRRHVEYRDKQKEGGDFEPVADYWENSLWCALQKEGIFCHLTDLRAVIHSDFSPAYDPFRSYFENLPAWDGQTDPIGRLAATIKTTRPDFWEKCLKKWLVALVACAIDKQTENHTVLLLSGAQGLGKTTWLRHLVPPELREYTYSGNLDPAAKDSSLMMSDCFLIILDELSGQSRMEVNRLKAMITKDAIRERRPYARNAEVYDRRASFAATVNDSQILTDRTGSRRFLCFEATQIDYTTPVDYAGIYAQALALYRDGFRYWFADADIVEVNDNNEPFQQVTPEIELFYTYFRKNERFEPYILLSSSEIVAKLAEKTRLPLTNVSVNLIGKMLKREGFVAVKRHGKWLYCVVELNHDQVETRRKDL